MLILNNLLIKQKNSLINTLKIEKKEIYFLKKFSGLRKVVKLLI